MANDVWYDYFLKMLSVKYPKKAQLVTELMDLLCIEQEAVYRRLRKDVIFHAFEIAKIASAWNISLDEIINVDSGKIFFQMQPLDYLNPSDQDVHFLQAFIDDLFRIKDFPDTEYVEICNRVPRPLLASYSYLNQFYLFRWMHQYGNKEETVPFSQIIISEEKRRITSEYCMAMKQIPNTNFIFSHRLIDNLVWDVRYFHSIQLITDEEKECIRKELHAFLDYGVEVASKGCYPETKNKVDFCISQLMVDTNYGYIHTNEANMCIVHAFDKCEIYTFNSEMLANFKTWMRLKKRASVQISVADEKSRIAFFARQRQVVESL